jgi:regulator of replication initiation timing
MAGEMGLRAPGWEYGCGIVRICPITGGLPTRMLERRFQELCVTKHENPGSYCALVCKGEMVPAELEFITLEMEEPMTPRKKAHCDICRKPDAQTAIIDGKNCCSTCEPLRRNARMRPEIMISQLQEFHPELLKQAQPAGKASLDALDILENNTALMEDNDRLQALIKEIAAENRSVKTELQAILDDNDRLQALIKEIAAENRSVKAELAAIQGPGGVAEKFVKEMATKVADLEECNFNLAEENRHLRVEKEDLNTRIDELEYPRIAATNTMPVLPSGRTLHLVPENDPVNHPPHYTSHPSGVECIEITEHMPFTTGRAIECIWKADEKGDDIKDLQKAIWYLNREINKRQLFTEAA